MINVWISRYKVNFSSVCHFALLPAKTNCREQHWGVIYITTLLISKLLVGLFLPSIHCLRRDSRFLRTTKKLSYQHNDSVLLTLRKFKNFKRKSLRIWTNHLLKLIPQNLMQHFANQNTPFDVFQESHKHFHVICTIFAVNVSLKMYDFVSIMHTDSQEDLFQTTSLKLKYLLSLKFYVHLRSYELELVFYNVQAFNHICNVKHLKCVWKVVFVENL